MEIVKCDGGEYGTDSVRLTCLANKYAAENILRDDNSVYCTKNPSCNLIFCHPHQIAFSVDHIVIDAPKRGYSAP